MEKERGGAGLLISHFALIGMRCRDWSLCCAHNILTFLGSQFHPAVPLELLDRDWVDAPGAFHSPLLQVLPAEQPDRGQAHAPGAAVQLEALLVGAVARGLREQGREF